MINEAVVFHESFLPMTIGITDSAILTEIYQEYLQHLGTMMELLRGPLEQSDKLYIELHKLKSSSASVGAQMLAGMLRDIEQDLLARRLGLDSNVLASLLMACKQTHDVISLHLDNLVPAA